MHLKLGVYFLPILQMGKMRWREINILTFKGAGHMQLPLASGGVVMLTTSENQALSDLPKVIP